MHGTELDLLKKPEYLHVLLNHLPIYGAMLGALALAISLVLRSRAAPMIALAIRRAERTPRFGFRCVVGDDSI